jgi:competence protein ComGC
MLDIMNAGIQAIIIVAILAVLMVLILHFLAQRSQQHMAEQGQANLINMHSMGLQAIIGANEMKIVDDSLQDGKTATQPVQTQTVHAPPTTAGTSGGSTT